ncbi:MAG: hypothetical protein U0235_19885 [Polyangiaceae bacterium]
MVRGPKALVGLGLGGAVAVASLWACLDPTQITLHVTTDLTCAEATRGGATIYGGDPRTSEGPLTTTRACAEGSPRDLGTLVLTPSGGSDDRVSVTVVGGVTRPSEECAAAGFAGCIVARRRLPYVAHKKLDLPILLSRSCVDVVCPEDQTCVPCTDAASCAAPRCAPIDTPGACEGPGGVGCTTGTLLDAGGGFSDGEAGSSDAGGPRDATVDAPVGATAFFTGVVNSGGHQVRGLAVTGSTLYWSQNGPITDEVHYVPLNALTGAAGTIIPALGLTALGGVDVVSDDAGSDLIVVASESATARLLFIDGGSPGEIFTGTWLGIGFTAPAPAVPAGNNEIFLSPGDGGPVALWRTSLQPLVNPPAGTGYVHHADGSKRTMLFASNDSIGRYDRDAGVQFSGVGPAGRKIRAVAELGTATYVTVTGPGGAANVFVRKTPADGWSPFGQVPGQPVGYVPGAEDLIVALIGGQHFLLVGGETGIEMTMLDP